MISIILSTNNELRNNYLGKLLDSIKNQDADYELIVIDNGSTDGTIDICKKYTDKIFELKNTNRAERLNLGIKKSIGDIILFHHPVSILPVNILSKIDKIIKKGNKWGGLSHSFDSNNLLLKFTSWYSNNIRGKLKGILYLDHCIFVEKKSVEKIGGFKNLDIFEDTVLSYDLKKTFGNPIILKNKIITSARRFTKRGILKQVFLNQYLKIMFHLGKGDKKMNKIYEEKEGFNVSYK